MARKKKHEINTEEIREEVARRLEEYNKQFIEDHTFKTSITNGNTYLMCDILDDFSEKAFQSLKTLLNLMEVEFSISYGDSFALIIDGDNINRAKFIQKFIDDGYKLKWE